MPSRDHSSSHYAHEAEVTRDRLARNFDELSDRLTPGQVFDEMLTYARGGGGTLMRTFSNAARENPIPSLLIGAGCMMFLSEKLGLNRMKTTQSNAEYERGAARRVADATVGGAKRMKDATVSGLRGAADFASDQTAAASEGAQQGAAEVGDSTAAASERIKGGARDLQDRLSDSASQLVDSGRTMAGAVQDYTRGLGDQASDTAAMAQRRAMRASAKLKDGAASFIHEQPLLCAAMGVAFGAALAALLPSTETEDEMLGEARDSVKSALGDAGSQQFETLKGAAGAVMEEAKMGAEREGLTSDGLADAVRNVGEKVKNVAADVGDIGSLQVEKVAGAGPGSASGDPSAPAWQHEGVQYGPKK